MVRFQVCVGSFNILPFPCWQRGLFAEGPRGRRRAPTSTPSATRRVTTPGAGRQGRLLLLGSASLPASACRENWGREGRINCTLRLPSFLPFRDKSSWRIGAPTMESKGLRGCLLFRSASRLLVYLKEAAQGSNQPAEAPQVLSWRRRGLPAPPGSCAVSFNQVLQDDFQKGRANCWHRPAAFLSWQAASAGKRLLQPSEGGPKVAQWLKISPVGSHCGPPWQRGGGVSV